MKRSLYVLSTILVATLLHGQSPTPNLRHLPAEQLRACLDTPKVCGTTDLWAITDEFVHRLPKLSTDDLLACFADWKLCGVHDDQHSGWPVSDELARRGNLASLLARYRTEPDPAIRGGIEHVAYHFDTGEAAAFMKSVLAERKPDGEAFYWPAHYLARRCDPAGLKELSSGIHRTEGCEQYRATIPLFGKCRYRPAIPYLVDEAISDACNDIAAAANDDLRILFPNAPKNLRTLDEAQAYYCSRAQQEGLKVNCGAK
jgi:hypothetical protein